MSLWQEAIDTVRGVTDSRERADAVATLAESAPESVRESLLDLALRIDAPYWRARGLVDSGLCISSAEFKRNVLTRVVAVNVAIESPRQQLIILSRTLRLRAQLGEFAAAWVGLPEGKRVEIVSEVTDLFDSALIGGGLRAAAAIADPRQRDGTLASLVERLAALGDVAEALRVVESIKGAEYRSMALAGISAELAKQGNGAEALSIARQIARPAARTRALAAVARTLSGDEWKVVFASAREAAELIVNLRERAAAQAALADCVARTARSTRHSRFYPSSSSRMNGSPDLTRLPGCLRGRCPICSGWLRQRASLPCRGHSPPSPRR